MSDMVTASNGDPTGTAAADTRGNDLHMPACAERPRRIAEPGGAPARLGASTKRANSSTAALARARAIGQERSGL